jgi:hypothetical protein
MCDELCPSKVEAIGPWVGDSKLDHEV